jgi:H+/Cl- antiporter ClcA
VVAGFFFAVVAIVFMELTHHVDAISSRFVPDPRWRTAFGGALVIVATLALGTRQYNGLSLPLLSAAFSPDGVVAWAFLAKLVLTALTLGVGYKGGEVTPLFVIGATAGATFGIAVGLPPIVMAALGFVTVFGAAAQTPIACVLLGVELFGADIALPLTLCIAVATAAVGQRGLYASQRLAVFHDGFASHLSGPRRADVWRRRR